MPDYFRAIAKEWLNILFGETLVGIAFLIWWALGAPRDHALVTVFVIAMFVAGYYAWRAHHVRLEPKIEISRICSGEWTVARDDAHAFQQAKSYYIELVNQSEGVTTEGISVQLSGMSPPATTWNFLPIALHLQHDNPSRPEDQIRHFTLNPKETRNIDFISALEGDNRFSVVHVMHGATHLVPYTGNNRLQVRVTAKNTPAFFVWFKVWRDGAGALQCEIEK